MMSPAAIAIQTCKSSRDLFLHTSVRVRQNTVLVCSAMEGDADLIDDDEPIVAVVPVVPVVPVAPFSATSVLEARMSFSQVIGSFNAYNIVSARPLVLMAPLVSTPASCNDLRQSSGGPW